MCPAVLKRASVRESPRYILKLVDNPSLRLLLDAIVAIISQILHSFHCLSTDSERCLCGDGYHCKSIRAITLLCVLSRSDVFIRSRVFNPFAKAQSLRGVRGIEIRSCARRTSSTCIAVVFPDCDRLTRGPNISIQLCFTSELAGNSMAPVVGSKAVVP